MTKYRERSYATVEVHGDKNGNGLWIVTYLDGPKAGAIEQHSTESLNRRFEPVPVIHPIQPLT